MNTRYEYKGSIYSEDDLSEKINNYGGNLFDLYFELKKNGLAHEGTIYCAEDSSGDYEKRYKNVENLIENEAERLGIMKVTKTDSIVEHYQSQLHDIVDSIDEMLSLSKIDRKKLQSLRNNIWKEL